jgi:sugar-specific transcriptional regulator TrmB/DNA-binding CsgD family transcriptional regulator
VLDPLGISDTDERVYRALLQHHHAGVNDLMRAARTTRPAVTAALNRLERLGLVARDVTESACYTPAAPDSALVQLIRRRTRELEQLRLDANELVADFYAASVDREPQGILEIFAGPEAVLRQARALEHATTSEILSFDKPPFLVEALADQDEVGNESPLLERGVTVRAIYTTDAITESDRFSRVTELLRRGEQARVLPELPLKLRIFDRQTALIPLAADVGVMHTVAVVHHSALLEALVCLFDALWDRATPLNGGDPATTPSPLSAEDERVVSMLAAGMSDEAIARQLGVSARTARRRVQRLLHRLHAATPFQAGAAAARGGHI